MKTNTMLATGTAALEMPVSRVVRAYLQEARFEVLHHLRTPAMGLPFLLMPPLVYLLFGVLMAGSSKEVQANPNLAAYIFSGWCAFAAMGPALFGVGCGLAVERDAGLLQLKRALPAPTGSFLAAKLLMAMAFALVAVTSVIAMALVTRSIGLDVAAVARLGAVMVLGAVPLAAIGFFIGAVASGSAAPAYANLLFLPMLWLSGLFFPVPKVLEPFVVIWPAFHLNQVALAAAGVKGFRFFDPTLAAAVLVGMTVLFGGLAVRRLARVG